MATTAMQNFQRRFKGISVTKLIDTATGSPFHLPNYDFVFNPGQEIEVLEIANAVGSASYAGYTISAEKPSFEITFKHNPPEVIEMITGYKFEQEANAKGEFSTQFTIGKDGTVPAVAVGQLGDTIVLDDPGVSVSIIDSTFSYNKPLTRVAAGAPITTPTEYSVGVRGALTFSPTLAGQNGTLIASSTFTTALRKSETQIGTYNVRSTLIMADSNRIALLSANNCEVQLGSAQFNPKSPETTLTLMPIADLGKCTSYDLMYIDKVLAC
jgi:hypothetical protein